MAIRTDLALEAKALWERSAEKTTHLAGVRATQRERDGTPITQVDILDERGSAALGKPVGRYLTMDLPRYDRDARTPAAVLAQELRELLALGEGESVLVVGLGNPAVTPDALGPQTVARLFLTRHLIASLPEQFRLCRSVSAVTPGVLATTGIESLEQVRGTVAHVRPDRVLAIDALAAGSMERLCRTVQLSDTGIVPGSGVRQPPRRLFRRDARRTGLLAGRSDRGRRGGALRGGGGADGRDAPRHRRAASLPQCRARRRDQPRAAHGFCV